MKSVIKTWFGIFLSLFLVFYFQSVDAHPVLMTSDIENDHNLMDSKSIDDLLGPDTNFPFDPANHRDGSNPIKRIGKISDDNL